MTHPTITAHMLVQNEDIFVWYALQSILPFVDQIFITDNGSADHTIDHIKSINSPKIKLTQCPPTDRQGLIHRRRVQLAQTKTDWFFLLDGDEIWPESNFQHMLQLIKSANSNIQAIACRTRNSVGDVFHYQPESAGNYQILNHRGHLTIRFFKHSPELRLEGEYPLEVYTYQGQPLQQQADHLLFTDTWYLHATHLPRSSSHHAANQVIDRLKKYKLEIGIPLETSQLPAVFNLRQRPKLTPDPLKMSYSFPEKFLAHILTPLRNFKRTFTR